MCLCLYIRFFHQECPIWPPYVAYHSSTCDEIHQELVTEIR